MQKSKTGFYTIQPNSIVFEGNIEFVVLKILSLEYVLCENVKTGEVSRIKISELSNAPRKDKEQNDSVQILSLPDTDWAIAKERFEIIKPLINDSSRTLQSVKDRASQYDIHYNSIYKWLKLYENSGLLTSLAPKKRNDKGTTKLSAAVETIISACIETEYLTKQKKSIRAVQTEIEKQCRNAELKAPHKNTTRNRILALTQSKTLLKREGIKSARDKYSPSGGEFPGADYPWAVLQIDHTQVDIILVDDEYRMPLDRPWLTLAMDVASRVVLGFYISFETPGAIATGMCLAHAILPKEDWLIANNIEGKWPCWGLPKTVHADNAKEFRGLMLQKACDEYGINIEWRPVARPHFGGHVERLLGTFAKEIHTLPGTTFSNIQQRGSYDSTKHASLTLKEFERWLCTYIIDVYHNRFHTGINCSPIKKYEEGIFGTSTTKGIGLPQKITEELTLKINFLPYEMRSVQTYGILWDGIFYYDDVLRYWINHTESSTSKKKSKFLVRRDPRDISHIWFFDPYVKTYYSIPYRNILHPPISLWEMKRIKKKLKTDGLRDIDEDAIFTAYEKMGVIVDEALQKTKSARKASQHQKSKKNAVTHNNKGQLESYQQTMKTLGSVTESEGDEEEILPFDDLDRLGDSQ